MPLNTQKIEVMKARKVAKKARKTERRTVRKEIIDLEAAAALAQSRAFQIRAEPDYEGKADAVDAFVKGHEAVVVELTFAKARLAALTPAASARAS